VDRSIFKNLDWQVVLYAASMAIVMSIVMTWRARNHQKAAGLALASWTSLVPDTIIGTITGTVAAIGVPLVVPVLQTFLGVTACAGVGGVLGPKLWDFIQGNGMGIFKAWIANAFTGLGKAMATATKDKED
jgi:FtsH-binding integral membrane protein